MTEQRIITTDYVLNPTQTEVWDTATALSDEADWDAADLTPVNLVATVTVTEVEVTADLDEVFGVIPGGPRWIVSAPTGQVLGEVRAGDVVQIWQEAAASARTVAVSHAR